LVIVYEAWKVGGSGGEVAAVVAEDAFRDLKAPIVRVAPPHIPIPFAASLNKLYLPDKQRVVEGVEKVMAY